MGTTKIWTSGAVADFNTPTDWGGSLPESGDLALVDSGVVEFTESDLSPTDFVPAGLTIDVGVSAPTFSNSPTSGLLFSDIAAGAPLNLTIDDEGSGGTINSSTAGPIIEAGLGMDGAVNFSGKINVGAGDFLAVGIASDSASTSAPTGYFNNLGTISLSGNLTNYAFAAVSQGNVTGDSSAGAFADYGTVNLNYGLFYASAPDATSTSGLGSGVFNLSNFSELAVVNTFFTNTTINFKDDTDQLLLGETGAGGFADGGAITGFQAGDVIGLLSSGVTPQSLGYSNGVLSIYSGANQTGLLGTLNVGGGYTASEFKLSQSSKVEVSGYGYTSQYNITIKAAPVVSVTLTGNAGVAAAGSFNQFLGFGDSNIDSGYFLNTPISNNSTTEAAYQAAVAAGGGLPTSIGGVMNSVLLAQDFGLSAAAYNPNTGNSGSALGTNYAASGATVTGSLAGSLAPSIASQIETYLSSTGGVANPDALYLLSGGGNDIKLAENMTTAQGDAFMVSEANAFASSIETLHSDGAKYIVLDNLTGATNFSLLFNSTVDTDLAAAGVSFIDGNTDGLVLSIEANPSGSQYGATYDFTNTSPAPAITASTPYSSSDGAAALNPYPTQISGDWSLFATALVSPNAATTDLWADNEHLAAEGQQIEANYYQSLIEHATPTVNETLTANPAVVNGNGSNFAFQWQALSPGQTNWSDISGQTASTFVVSNADVGHEIRVETIFTDSTSGAVESAYSAPTYAVAPCYCAGALILTDRGEVAVEKLEIGDRVLTIGGAARPIKWMGTRAFDGRFIGGNRDILPICIRAGALDENIPSRDLLISPHHALYLEGVLIEAKDLVNGVSITQAHKVERVDYFHVELFSHDVIFAEGAPAETFVDEDSRAMFQNAADYYARYPREDADRRSLRPFAPRLDEGFELDAARKAIAARAGIAAEPAAPGELRGWVEGVTSEAIWGWAQDAAAPDAPVCLHVLADGCVIGRALANRYRADLQQAGLGNGRHAFCFAAPKGVDLTGVRVELRRAGDGESLAGPDQRAA